MRSIRVDGNDLAAVYMATRQAREACVEHGEPVLIEMMTYRRGHHSTSDDATRYRPGQQLQDMSRQGLEPMSRTRLMLTDAGKWSEAEEEALREETRAEVMEAMRVSEAKPFAAVSDMFADVWAKPPESLKRQQEELSAHLRRHPEHFKERLAKYAGSC